MAELGKELQECEVVVDSRWPAALIGQGQGVAVKGGSVESLFRGIPGSILAHPGLPTFY